MWNRFTSQIHFVGIGAALLLLTLVATVGGIGWRDSTSEAVSAAIARENIRGLQDLLAEIQLAESLERGFLLTRKTAYLDHYAEFTNRAKQRLAALQRLARTNPDYAGEATQQLCQVSQEKLDFLNQTIQLAKAGKLDADLTIARTDHGQILINRITDLERQVENRQHRLRDLNRNRTQDHTLRSEVIATFGSIGIFAIVLFSFLQILKLMETRKELAAQLSLAAEEFRNLADCVPQFVWRRSQAGEVIYVNQEWIRFSGLREEQAAGGWQDLLHPDDRLEFLDRWQESLKQQTKVTAECRMKESSTGRYHWLLFRAKPIPNPSMGLQWYCTFTDIDQQKNTEKSLVRANADLKQLASAAAHDLQEPLRNVSLTLELLLQEGGCARVDGTTGSLITDSLGNAQRMLGMIRDLLVYTSIFDGPQEDDKEVDVEICIRYALAKLDTEIRAAGGAQVRWEALPPLHIQKAHLVQLFQQLIGNAVKFRKPNTKPMIQIGAERQGASWTWSVLDNGIGFNQAYSSRIFCLFKRLHDNREYPGSGIGLAICERIVSFYGGRIWAESTPNQGAAFKFTLPA